MNKTIIVLLIIVAVLFLGVFFFRLSPALAPENGTIDDMDASDWQTYRNEQFGFEIKIPADWQIAEFTEDRITTTFNFYPPEVLEEPPFIHHSFPPNVSVFPFGVPTEGIFGTPQDSQVVFSEEVRVATDFVLEDGTPWATFATFTDPPPSWSEAGFVWAKVRIENLEIECLRGEEVLDEFACDPLFGDEIIRYGEVNEKERGIQEAILSSLRFL